MEGEIGTGTTYGSNVKFARLFYWENQNEERSQETKTYAKLQLSTERYMKREVCEMWNALKWFRICRRSRLFCKR
jgi:hypothetical protein